MELNNLAQAYGKSMNYTGIDNHLYKEYNVKKGLRNEDGTGVIVGLTKVADVVGYEHVDGVKTPSEGKLFYRGISITDLVNGKNELNAGFEEVCFLLLFGYLPSAQAFDDFKRTVRKCYELPERFTELNFLNFPSQNLMNLLQSSVLSLYNYDPDPETLDVFRTLAKGINILAKMPMMICYGYQSQQHYLHRKSLVIHYPVETSSIAENILYMLRDDMQYTAQEVEVLDTMLMIHAEHGGGNNSTFANVVISSTGTDIYSAISGSIGSLKGPKHGGANISCSNMIQAIMEEVGIDADERALKEIVTRTLDGNFFDRSGLVYGIGHAVYTLSDPRTEILREKCRQLAAEKGRTDEIEFIVRLENAARQVVSERLGKPVATNVDFYSGFAYKLLGIPTEIYTPLFVCARTVGWVAHNVENKLYDGKIMRPATRCVVERGEYSPMRNRR